MKRSVLISIGVVALLGIGGCAFAVTRNRKQDKKSAAFIEELNKKLNPATEGLEGEEALQADYQLDCPASKLLEAERAKAKAKDIHDAWGKYWWIDDKESQVYSALRTLANKCQLSQVSDAYYKGYKITLIDDIKDRMDESEVETVMGIINQLKQ